MPSLEQSLQGRDLGHLKILADFWGIEFNPPDTRVGLQRLIPTLLDEALLNGLIQSLPEGARRALIEICENDARIAWALLTRRYGTLREMGLARRDRERPYQNSQASATEALWYRGLIGRAFFDTENGPQEFAYIPEEFVGLLPTQFFQSEGLIRGMKDLPLGRLATRAEKALLIPATDWILDDACTALAGLRMGMTREAISSHLILGTVAARGLTIEALLGLLQAAGLTDAHGVIRPEPVRRFLESSRAEALLELTRGWLRSVDFNELRLIPGLTLEGAWRNDPLAARQVMLDFLSAIPSGRSDPTCHCEERSNPSGENERPFCSLQAFVASIRQKYPDFQRAGGEYDSWYILDQDSQQYLRGFEYWDQVEGSLIRFFIEGPLHWLGMLDLASGEDVIDRRTAISAFRYSALAFDLLNLQIPAINVEEAGLLIVKPDGRLVAPRLLPRPARYQIARFSEWLGYSQDAYQYQLTPRSLTRAGEQGLSLQHLLLLMGKHTRAVPPSLLKALQRWEEHGPETRFEQVLVLRVKNPEIIQALRKTKANRFLGEPLGTAAVIIQPGALEKVVSVLTELGYLAEVEIKKANDAKGES